MQPLPPHASPALPVSLISNPHMSNGPHVPQGLSHNRSRRQAAYSTLPKYDNKTINESCKLAELHWRISNFLIYSHTKGKAFEGP